MRDYTNSLSGRADGGEGGDDDRSQLAARYGRLLPFGQGYNRKIVAAFLRSGRQFLKALSLGLFDRLPNGIQEIWYFYPFMPFLQNCSFVFVEKSRDQMLNCLCQKTCERNRLARPFRQNPVYFRHP